MAEEITRVKRFTVSREELEKALKQGDAICELRDRVAALESRQQDAGASIYDDSQATVTPPPAVPSDEELWNVQLEARRQSKPWVDWQTWQPQWNVDKAQISANRALFDAGVAWANARAEQQQEAAAEESSAAQSAPADPDDRKWITDRRPVASEANFYGCVEVPASCRSSEPITREGRRYTKFYMIKEGEPWLPASFDYRKSREAIFDEGYRKGLAAARAEQHAPYTCPHIRSSDEGTSYCALAEQPAPAEPAPEPAPLPPIRVGQKWRRGDGVVAEIIKVDHPGIYSVKALHSDPTVRCTAVRSSALYTSEGKYINDGLPCGAYPYDLAELIEDAPAPTEPAPLAPACGLVEEIRDLLGHYGTGAAREAIEVTARWLRWAGFKNAAAELEKEATR